MKIMKAALIVSIALNVLLVGAAAFYIQMNGGERFLKTQWRALTSDQPFNDYYLNQKSVFEAASADAPVDKVFIGDSLTDHGQFGEYFPGETVINRGIRDDTSYNVLHRIKEVAEREPKEAYILVGINDIMEGIGPEEYEKNVRKIVGAFDHGKTEVTLFSILPVNHDLIGNSIRDEEIAKYNGILRKVAEESGADLIDLHPAFLDDKGQLDQRYTIDGVHLNGAGYDVWMEKMKR